MGDQTDSPTKNLVAGILLLWACLFTSCDSTRVYEENIDLVGNAWEASDTKRFGFVVNDTTIAYNIQCNLRSTLDYPNYNLYMKYWLYDSLGKPLNSDLKNLVLFDPESGEPQGSSSIGDIFSYELPLMTDYEFKHAGRHTIVLQHFMRTDTLREVVSVGLRVERAK